MRHGIYFIAKRGCLYSSSADLKLLVWLSVSTILAAPFGQLGPYLIGLNIILKQRSSSSLGEIGPWDRETGDSANSRCWTNVPTVSRNGPWANGHITGRIRNWISNWSVKRWIGINQAPDASQGYYVSQERNHFFYMEVWTVVLSFPYLRYLQHFCYRATKTCPDDSSEERPK